MANPEHVEIVKQGAGAIRKWRMEHPAEILNLSGADLSGSHLNEVDLREANLREANLRDSKLGGANLSEAILCEIDLRGCLQSRKNVKSTSIGRIASIENGGFRHC